MARLNPAALARLRDILQAQVDDRRMPGCVAVVALGGEPVLFEAFGVRDPADANQQQQAMPLDAIFRIYSMTKPIVSLAALMLMEEGRLLPDDPVARYLPEFAAPQVAVQAPAHEGGQLKLVPALREPTVHDLLRHTAGFAYDHELPEGSALRQQYQAAELRQRERSNAQFCKVLATLPLAQQPGSCWQYGWSTDVLGAVLEVITGQGLGDLLRERILAPLGMHDTAFGVAPHQLGRIAEPFATDPDTGAPVYMLNVRKMPRLESGGGGLLSTAADYTRFLQLMRGQGTLDGLRLVSRKTIEWMVADHLGSLPVAGVQLAPGHGFGLGYAVRLQAGVASQPGSAGAYHWSGIGGTSFFVDPTEDLFAILMAQAPGQCGGLRKVFRGVVYGAVD